MIELPRLQGCITALITPMKEKKSHLVVDYDKLTDLVVKQIEAGVSGILFIATTGQSATLSVEEKIAVTVAGTSAARQATKDMKIKPVLVAAAGSNSTSEAIRCTRNLIESANVDAVLHVTGYYNNPPQEGLIKHFEAVADAGGEYEVPVILYNVPSRTNSDLSVDSIIALSKHQWIIALKEASGDLKKVEAIMKETNRNDFTVLSGEDHQVADIIGLGGSGVISASANMWPAQFERLARLALQGRQDEARELQEALLPCVHAVFSAKNPIPLAWMLGTKVRLPLVGVDELDSKAREKVLSAVERAQSIDYFPHMEQREE
ncbi:MAG: 4-hydroxy-tetrahydrodipicolinate synthase [Deltaproteobacteria bacterium]|nr:4-hydroxy-tetrahydrodipicolinate synthase [Deltaproteobacteria bacterium]